MVINAFNKYVVYIERGVHRLRHQGNNKTMKRRRIKYHFYIPCYNNIKALSVYSVFSDSIKQQRYMICYYKIITKMKIDWIANEFAVSSVKISPLK